MNKHIGSSLDDLLEQDGTLDQVNARAQARVDAWQRRRDAYIQAALTGLLANGDWSENSIPGMAVKMADATIAAADKAEGGDA